MQCFYVAGLDGLPTDSGKYHGVNITDIKSGTLVTTLCSASDWNCGVNAHANFYSIYAIRVLYLDSATCNK